jgi:hypothetical protein
MCEQFRVASKFRIFDPQILFVMKKTLTSLFLVLCFCVSSSAWGPTGHRATGHIANKYLNTKARKNLERILKGQSLAIASTWMDEVRSDSTFDYMTDWHWVTIPDGQTYDQTTKNPKAMSFKRSSGSSQN